jgi:predicted amino acid racemase
MPRLYVDIEAIGRNTEAVAALLRRRGLDLVAVTKGCLGEPRVAAAMLAGGAVALADTRDLHLRRLREALPKAELHRIDLPSVVRPFVPGDITYVSSVEGAHAVAESAVGTGAAGSATAGPRGLAAGGAASGGAGPRRVMVAVETGDEREGVPLDLLLALAEEIAADPRLRMVGVATNYACFRGGPEGIRGSVRSVTRAAGLLREAGLPVERVSGGNSSVLWLLAQGEDLPSGVTELRCGEALLLGHDALQYRPLPGCHTDACLIQTEVVEEYTKPAAGGPAHRLLLAVGRQDLGGGAVEFVEPGLREIGRSSDYMVVEAAAEAPWSVGMTIEMIPGYEALVAAWMSPYVELRWRVR